MLGGDFMFSLNDAMGKWLVVTLSVGQVVFIRSIGAFIVLGPMIAHQGPRALFVMDRPWLQFARAILDGRRDAALLRRGLLSAACRRDQLLHGRADLCRGALASAARRDGRLAALDSHPRRFLRRRHHAAAVAASFSLASIYALVGSILFGLTIILGRLLRGTSDTTLVTWQTIGTLIVGRPHDARRLADAELGRMGGHAAARHRLLPGASDDRARAEACARRDARAFALHACFSGP